VFTVSDPVCTGEVVTVEVVVVVVGGVVIAVVIVAVGETLGVGVAGVVCVVCVGVGIPLCRTINGTCRWPPDVTETLVV
jgi:hypothetical protein